MPLLQHLCRELCERRPPKLSCSVTALLQPIRNFTRIGDRVALPSICGPDVERLTAKNWPSHSRYRGLKIEKRLLPLSIDIALHRPRTPRVAGVKIKPGSASQLQKHACRVGPWKERKRTGVVPCANFCSTEARTFSDSSPRAKEGTIVRVRTVQHHVCATVAACRAMRDNSQRNRIAMFCLIEHPTSGVHEHCDIQLIRGRENSFTKVRGAHGSEYGARKYYTVKCGEVCRSFLG